jgi:hypothetical protein
LSEANTGEVKLRLRRPLEKAPLNGDGRYPYRLTKSRLTPEIRRQKAEGRRQKAEGRRQKAEGRKQKAEGRRQRSEVGGQKLE